MSLKASLLALLCLLGGGCAGPMNPFGAINEYRPQMRLRAILSDTFEGKKAPVTIEFSPNRQVLHDLSDFEINISDEQEIPKDRILKIYYNGQEVTSKLRDETRYGPYGTADKLKFSFNNLRLKANRKNKIVVHYKRDEHSSFLVNEYLPPHCSMYDENYLINTGSFDNKKWLINQINSLSTVYGVNPGFVGGLIAQESGFNNKAVSWAKALGLTQVTSIAEPHIIGIEEANNWPRYPGIKRMGHVRLRGLIYLGKINRHNEWRLDYKKSIIGGIHYLNFLSNYWHMPKQRNLLSTQELEEVALSDVLLASYNSGASRVKYALKKHGNNWLNSRNLKAAKEYVGKVNSYCYHFSRGGMDESETLNL